ncbi:hypothetical protein [Priestia megaterium]|uniref:hypothetical protein n=1 Tax=Priestia megaterium TaxID=1404 RepID=UPI002E1B69C6|nr:hypothetical protein [Priestia megaterium]
MKTVTVQEEFNYNEEVIKAMVYIYLYNAEEKGRKVVFTYKDVEVKKGYQDDEISFQDVVENECKLIDELGAEGYEKHTLEK